MSKRMEIVSSFYNRIDEDARLKGSRQGQLEYRATMEYIRRYAKPGAKILEIGAGTGRYSIDLAKEGYKVTAVELVDSILELAEGRIDFKMSDKEFELFVKYHLATCEKREMLGCSSHLLYICEKEN